MKAFKILIVVLVLAAGGWYAWGKFHDTDKADEAKAATASQGPMPISVATLQPRAVQQWLQFSGRLVAVDTVEVRPRVGGAIQKIYFEPGEIVEKDAPLFLIDPRPYEAEVSQARAALAAAKAQMTLSQTDLARAQRLINENAISRRDVDERQNANRLAEAALKGAEATLQQAELNLNYATIRSPVRGRISRAEITLGNLVNAGSPVLATIVSVDSIYADFEVDEQTYLTMFRMQNKSSAISDDSAFPVELVLNSDNTEAGQPAMSYPGKIVSFDNKLDTMSGTIRSRAIFSNKDKALVPGMYANVRLGQAQAQDAILIPERLISTDQDKKFVYIVSPDNKVAYRAVTLGGIAQGMRIITAGLQPGDRIITDALQKIRPDMPIEPREVALTDSANTNVGTQQADGTATDAAKVEPAAQAEPTPAEPESAPVSDAEPAAENTTAEATPKPDAMPASETIDSESLQPIETKSDTAPADTAPDDKN